MKLEGSLKNIKIGRYLATGCLEKKQENPALQKMLEKIKREGIEKFENDEVLKNFSKGMICSFQKEGFLTGNKELSATGEDIVKTGKVFQKMYGTFIVTICEYENQTYILDLELYKKDKEDKGIYFEEPKSVSVDTKELFDSERCQTRNVNFEEKISEIKESCKWSNRLFYDMDSKKPVLEIKDEHEHKYTITENSCFKILSDTEAQTELRNLLSKTKCLSKKDSERTSVIVKYDSEELPAFDEKLIQEFFEKGEVQIKDEGSPRTSQLFDELVFDDVHLRIEEKDSDSLNKLLHKYLIQEAEKSYLDYSETGRQIRKFSNLFETAPEITDSTKDIYAKLIEDAGLNREKNPVPYLHLRAYLDLPPEQILRPYYEEEPFNFAGQRVSVSEIVEKVFGDARSIKCIAAISKFAPTNPTICRNSCVFASAVKKQFGVKFFVITQKFDGQKQVPAYEKQNREFFDQMKNNENIEVIEKDRAELIDHDRYYIVQRESGDKEWYKATCELDTLRFGGDEKKNLRKNIDSGEPADGGELTFIKIKESAVPENSRSIFNKLLTSMQEK